MQLKLQEHISTSGLVLETLRPTFQRDKAKDKDIGEVQIKMRLSGSLDEFARFLASLYKSKHLFHIESFTLKPFRGAGLKIFIDMKGFYMATENGIIQTIN